MGVGKYVRKERKRMGQQVKLTVGNISVQAELNDSQTAKEITQALPFEARGNRWGGEIYFPIEVRMNLEQGCRDVLDAGELGYWPTGNAFCIFFGKTPASQGDEIRAASDVNIIGKITGDSQLLWDVPDGAKVVIEKI
jgi:hypothetical protein